MSEGMFSVIVKRVDGETRWVVTCERCGDDLSHAMDVGVNVISVRGFVEFMANNPEGAEVLRKKLGALWDDAVRTRKPLVIDRDEMKVEHVGGDLTSVLHAHIDTCSKRGPGVA